MSSIQYRRDIDGLRALAILPVILYHAGISGFSGGFIGVDIFFVISGYLITSIIIREIHDGSFRLTDFWARRARRILPAATLMVIATLIAGWFLMLPYDYAALGYATKDQAVFMANFYFWKNTGYFDGASELMPLLHTWSLAVEEQFYLLFPLTFMALHKFAPRFKLLGLLSVFFASLLASIIFLNTDPSATFYLVHTRAWELAIGAILAFIPYQKPASKTLCEVVSMVSLIVIGACVVIYDSSMAFPGAAALPPTLATGAIIWANSYHSTAIKRLLSTPLLVWFGLTSYSLYLWHWPLFSFARYGATEELVLLDKIILITLSIVLGYLSWRFIETPFRKKQLLPGNKAILISALLSIVLVAVIGQQIRIRDGFANRLPEAAAKIVQTSKKTSSQKRCKETTVEQIESGEFCSFPADSTSPVKVFVWGDSHALSILPAIKERAEKYGEHTMQAVQLGCLPAKKNYGRPAAECIRFNQQILNHIELSKPSDVILAARWSGYIYKEELLGKMHKGLLSHEDFKHQLPQLVDHLHQLGIRVWIVRQVPEQKKHVITHLTRLAIENKDTSNVGIPLSEHVEYQAFVNSVFTGLEGDNVTFLDPAPLLCTNKFCPVLQKGASLYEDFHHLSPFGALRIKEIFNPVYEQASNQ